MKELAEKPASANGVSSGFNIQVSNMTEAMELARMMSSSALAPKDFKNKPDDTLIAMMMGNELGLNPMQSIQNIAVINGRPCIWGDAMLALVQNHPSFDEIEETFDDSKMTAICTVTRKGGKPHVSKFSQEDAVLAGLWGNNTWKKYPKRMLAMRARGFALRNQFADALLGLITREEALDYPDEKEINPVVAIPKEPEYYDEGKFTENLPAWKKTIASKNKSPVEFIAFIESKGVLFTDDQKNQIKGVNE
jgi:hypothetical protein